MTIVHHLIRVVVSALSLYQINALFTFHGLGLAECPENYYQIQFSSTCTAVCRPDAPLTFKNLCLTFCPYGYAYNETVTTCSNSTELREVDPSTHCQVTACPSDKPLCYDKQCLSECPNGTIHEKGNCLHNCSDISPLVLHDSCVSTCPNDNPYDEYGHCVAACSSEYFLYGQRCLRSCPHHTYQYSTKCIDACPPEAPKSLRLWNVSLCVASCPGFTSINGSKCEVECPNGRDYLWNGSCVGECPETAPLIYVLTRRVPPYEIPICIPKCPSHSYLKENRCVSTCSLYQLNSTCVSSCPVTHPYFEGISPPFECVTTCRPQQILNIDHCVDKCPTGLFAFNSTCVNDCPTTHLYTVNQTCLSNCPSTMVVYNRTCQLSCPDAVMYIYDGRCYRECPDSHPYHHQTHTGQMVCQATAICPEGKFSWNNNCLYQCPDNTVYINSTCLEECPLSNPLKYRRDNHRSFECVTECPENTFRKDEYCFEHCDPPLIGFSGNNTCLERCPDSDQWRSVVTTITNQLSFICVANCSSPRLIDDHNCLVSCPNSKPFAVNQTCLKSCPNDSNLITPFGNNGMTCSKTCPETYIQDNDTCVLKCSPGKVIINGACVDIKYCVHDYQYFEDSQHGTICRKRCLDSQFVDNIRCVTSCPLFSVGKLCVTECPSRQKFTRVNNSSDDGSDRKCYEECPRKTYANGTKCILIDCPMKYLAGSRTCVSTCTISYPYLEDHDRCVNRCSDGYVITKENRCIRHRDCLKQKGSFVYDEHCVDSCPSGTFVNYVSGGCILSSIVYLVIIAAVLSTVLLIAGMVWFYYYRKGKHFKTCFSKIQDRCAGDTPLLTEDVLTEGYALTDIATDHQRTSDVVS